MCPFKHKGAAKQARERACEVRAVQQPKHHTRSIFEPWSLKIPACQHPGHCFWFMAMAIAQTHGRHTKWPA